MVNSENLIVGLFVFLYVLNYFNFLARDESIVQNFGGLFTGDNMLTALSVARDSSMVSTFDRVLLLTAHLVKGNDQKLSLQWSPISDIHNSECDITQEMNGEDIRQVSF